MALYDRVADRELAITDYSLDRHEQATSSDFTRVTTTITLEGPDAVGVGEDVTYDTPDHDTFQADFDEDLSGTYTVVEFSTHLDGIDLFPEPPARETSRDYRRWAFESAALDLALSAGDTTFHDAVDRTADPVDFVASTRLGDPPTADRVRALTDRVPDVELKLDPTTDWTPDLVDELAALAPVRILDLKGHYETTTVDGTPDPELYDRVATAFPDAIIEDPALTPETRPVLDAHMDRVSWDAPIHGLEDVHALEHDPHYLNVKPSRFGTVESLLDTIEYGLANDITLYAGGQFELAAGRSHLHELAATFHPTTPNDAAPPAYNDTTLPDTLPTSPLTPPPDATGLGWH
jgi:hypothetical protein